MFNDLGLTLNPLSIVCPRPNVKAFFPVPSLPTEFTGKVDITLRYRLLFAQKWV
jgi:hypothetical protein